ncbi:AGE family epimerase/isomerase [Neiella marina]|uniref:AGE family epimerase/isomerase n=1 Tax=Neiella holothuriorum TaxID=2870530 RepID=A0ABS7EBN8_9GAMM|nr:AGE family epimerase/isomerase [Neiella holothuriorum]MBW8189747.1 AGE family epimerase/isomerase [Neiella holothuriorum]
MQQQRSLEQQVARFQSWMTDQALPLWTTKGIEPNSHAAYERLTFAGEPDANVTKRVRVQARQMFSFCVAEEFGWSANNRRIVNDIWRFSRLYGKHPQHPNTYIHLLAANNEVADAKQDLYDIAFHLLAAGTRYRLYRQERDIEHAKQLLHHLDTNFAADNGGWFEGDYDAPVRRQNPHMHLFEAFMTLYEASGDGLWLAKAGQIFSLFQQVFYDHDNGVLLEFFDSQWQPTLVDGNTVIEPGHLFEWVWLLDWYSRLTGISVRHFCERLYRNGLLIGKESSTGLIYDATTPQGEIIHATKRSWPMTELIKASLVMAQWQPEIYESKAAQAIDLLFTYYIEPAASGAYVDQLDDSNAICSDVAPASTFYHLIVALAESVRYLDRSGIAA